MNSILTPSGEPDADPPYVFSDDLAVPVPALEGRPGRRRGGLLPAHPLLLRQHEASDVRGSHGEVPEPCEERVPLPPPTTTLDAQTVL